MSYPGSPISNCVSGDRPDLHREAAIDRDHGCVSVEYGTASWLDGDYADINKAMCEAIEPHKEATYQDCRLAARKRDITTAKQLLEKHGVAVEAVLKGG